MAIQPNQPLSIGGVLDLTFRLFRASIVPVIPLCVLFAIVTSPPSIYMVANAGAITNPADPLAAFALMRSPGYWIAYAISLIGTAWAWAALYLKVAAIAADEDLSIGAALGKGLSNVPSLVVAMIAGFIAIAIGCLLLLVPGLILMVSLMLTFALVVFEGKGPIAALTGSHRLVWGNWWRTAAILVSGFIILMVLYMLAGFVFAFIMPFIGFGSEDAFVGTMVSSMLVGVLMSLLATPFFVALLLAVYWDLKLRKEGGDLAARVGALKPA